MTLPEFITKDAAKLTLLSREELENRYKLMADELTRVVRENYRLRESKASAKHIQDLLNEQLGELQAMAFGKSSERGDTTPKEKKKPQIDPKPRIKKPSERYPNIPIREVVVDMQVPPSCESCGAQMSDSGMSEETEQLTVIPKKFEIVRYIQKKYRCSCHACIKTAPLPPRLYPGSCYSDELILDVVLSKYCDLIPIERYAAMAARGGLKDLPPHSLIQLTHVCAAFVKPIYDLLKTQIMAARVLHADETPHRMLEGSEKKTWYLWGFSTPNVCLLDCRDTRSGDVASEILIQSVCEILVTDVYSGYGKAIEVASDIRAEHHRIKIQNANCNSHARRYFFKSRIHYPEANVYLKDLEKIYKLNAEAKGKSHAEILEVRHQMRPVFEQMKSRAIEELPRYPNQNQYRKALMYFIENYEGLTLFLTHADVPIDNNSQERLLRSHVVGRKTWYGTHSEQGAQTAAILFSIVETCKLNGVNPREYFKNLVQDLLAGKNPYTPIEFKGLQTI